MNCSCLTPSMETLPMANKSETSHVRSYFYVGGEYIRTPHGHILQNQMYVERLTPTTGSRQPYPLVFIHGTCQSGTNWLNKPDGGPGWATWFLQQGYEVFLIDQPHVGRSAWYPESPFPIKSVPAEFIQQRFTAPAKYQIWPQSLLHTQWPGTGLMGDPVFDTYYASTVPILQNGPEQDRATLTAGIALLEKIGPAIIIAHSQGSLAGWSWTDARPGLVKALIQIEPKGPPFREVIFSDDLTRPWGLTSTPLAYGPPPSSSDPEPLNMETVSPNSSDHSRCILQAEPARQLVNLARVPILILTAEASYHAMYDYCFLRFLNQAGCSDVEHRELWKVGIRGNGHLMFMEKNSDEIAENLHLWILGKGL